MKKKNNNITSYNLFYGSTNYIDNNLDNAHNKNKKKHNSSYYSRMLKNIYKYLFIFIFIIVGILFIRKYIVQHVVVDGSSMNNCMFNNDHLLIEKVSYRFKTPERFDIVVFEPYLDDESYFVKRIIGLPGEKVRISDGKIYINDTLLEESYGVDDTIANSGIANSSIYLESDEYFVLGDNRELSLDSRDSRVGNISGSRIVGKALVDVWPPKNFKIFN